MHVIATAGHVDHGKSTLIKRLTGIDPDRLEEEKARGLTIDLGFAWTALPSGREVGFVDVPGHERFITNMLAGVTSASIVLFVVAADEGWCKQSEEHLAIVDLLGLKHGIVAVTRADRADEAVLAATIETIGDRLASTTLSGASIIPVSGTTGQGCDILLNLLDMVIDEAGEPRDVSRPRVYVDRCFSVNGVGTVATGTLTDGSLRIDDPITLMPSGVRGRVRAIQSHKRVLEHALPVSRVAINLGGVEIEQVRRGDAVVSPGQWRPSSDVDVCLRVLPGLPRPVSNRGAFKVYIGSAETDATLSLYEGTTVEPGDTVFARFMLSHPIAAAPRDRFIIRDVGRGITVGGGLVLDAHPPVLRGSARHARPAQLQRRSSASAAELPSLVVEERGVVARSDLPWLSGSDRLPPDSVSLRTLEVSRSLFDQLAAKLEKTLADYHAEEPLAFGMTRDSARVTAGIKNVRLFSEMLDVLDHRITADGPVLRLPSHHVVINLETDGAHARLIDDVRDGRFTPPILPALEATHGERIVEVMLSTGRLIAIAPNIVFTPEQIDEAKALIAVGVTREGPLTASRIKELLGTSRRYAIPLLEYLDGEGFTIRDGDTRSVSEQTVVPPDDSDDSADANDGVNLDAHAER